MTLRRLSLFSAALGLCAVLGVNLSARSAEKASSSAEKAAKAEPDPFAPPAWVRAASRPSALPVSRPTSRPIAKVDHVVIISIDGCRPDLLLRCDAPTLRELYRGGAYSFWARTTPNSITLPSHTSMLTGVSPRKHGIEWNRDLPLARPVYSNSPTIFYAAKRAGYSTGMAAGKSKFDFLAVPGTLDFESIPEKSTGKDTDVAREAWKIITSAQPNLMFVHFPGVDNAGHKYGWGTPEQAEAVAQADRAVARVLDAISDAKLEDRTVVIISADHGGAGKNHGPDDPRCRHIPWIASGPGVKKGIDLTTDETLEIRTEDTFATACWLLGIPLDPRLDGKPVTAAFQLPKTEKPIELLRDVDSTGDAAAGTAGK